MTANPLRPGYCPADPRGTAALEPMRGTARRLAVVLRLWQRRCRERRDLTEFGQLDERVLRDIGLTRGSAEFLINKPFWRE